MTFDDLRRPPLDAGVLSAALTRGESLWREVAVLQTSPSTNAELARRCRAGAGAGLVVVAEHQTAGRGRLDRVWTTPPRAALTFSFLVAPAQVPTYRWPWLPLLTGLAVAESVRRAGDVACGLKWPNDVLVEDRKLAGILVERVETDRGPHAVVGVGINVSTTTGELPAGATSLVLEGAATTDRSVLLRDVLRTFEPLYRQWQAEAGDVARGLREAYRSRCLTLGRRVRVELPDGGRVVGEAVDVDEDGRLVVASGDALTSVGAGDVVHVRPLPA